MGTILGLLSFSLALAASGDLDTTFSGDGKVTTGFTGGWSEQVAAVALQSDGKIVVAGQRHNDTSSYMAVARYNADGSLDATFSGDGRQTVSIGTIAWANDVVVHGDGKIVMTSCGGSIGAMDFALARLLANGNLDTTFSGDGKLRVDFGGNTDCARGLARQADGKYVLAGYTYDSAPDDFALARVLP